MVRVLKGVRVLVGKEYIVRVLKSFRVFLGKGYIVRVLKGVSGYWWEQV